MSERPNFFIIGAPRSGTTSVYYWLKEHPEVYMSPEKEPNFFYSPFGNEMSQNEYESLFTDRKKEHSIVGEASVWYLFSGYAVDRILDYQPDAKFLVLLRNPVKMILSLHDQHVYCGYEKETDFKKAWQLSDKREKGLFIKVAKLGKNADATFMSYRKACKIGTQLQKVYDKVGKERIASVLTEDLQKDPLNEYNKLLNFLDLKYYGKTEFPVKNQTENRIPTLQERFKIKLNKLTQSMGLNIGLLQNLFENQTYERKKYEEYSLNFQLELLHNFKSEIIKLEELLSKDLSHWKSLR